MAPMMRLRQSHRQLRRNLKVTSVGRRGCAAHNIGCGAPQPYHNMFFQFALIRIIRVFNAGTVTAG
jgi:hypothetical protein